MEDVIEETPRGLALRLTLNLRGGLHARPAARLAQEAQRYLAKGDDAREALHGLARFLTTLQE